MIKSAGWWRRWLAGQICRCWKEWVQDRSLWIPFLRRRNLLHLPSPVVRVKLRLAPSPLSCGPYVCQVAIAVTCSWGHDAILRRLVTGCCEIVKHSTGLLLSSEAIVDVLCQQGDIYGWPIMSKARLVLREWWVDDWFDTKVDESLEDLEGDTQK